MATPYSVRQFVEAAFRVIGVKIVWSGTGLDEVGTDSATSTVRVRVNPEYYRTLENETLLGSAAKAQRVLGWQPKYTFDALVEEMVLSDIRAVKAGRIFAHTYLDLDWLMDESGDTSEHIKKTPGRVENAPERIEHAPGAPVRGIEVNGHETPVVA
ncbi:hypothetical protein N8T08_005105 [Aspergillus melleus]|uniref:Uncharacterized protein n=1 Tax=Aspergillus melleus TaxID=138277 RepID=A0ACC3BG27_9EURO|nr:hypothetical protein N8T08_005105 [Aspergillus melleus]